MSVTAGTTRNGNLYHNFANELVEGVENSIKILGGATQLSVTVDNTETSESAQLVIRSPGYFDTDRPTVDNLKVYVGDSFLQPADATLEKLIFTSSKPPQACIGITHLKDDGPNSLYYAFNVQFSGTNFVPELAGYKDGRWFYSCQPTNIATNGHSTCPDDLDCAKGDPNAGRWEQGEAVRNYLKDCVGITPMLPSNIWFYDRFKELEDTTFKTKYVGSKNDEWYYKCKPTNIAMGGHADNCPPGFDCAQGDKIGSSWHQAAAVRNYANK